jgi:ubiquinone/menaquinone biosynthesis C-methylase UbiE
MADSFDRVAARYDATRALPAAAEAAIAVGIARAVSATPQTRLLEIGVGTGRIALPLARQGLRCIGIDRSASMLATAQRKVHEESGQLLLAQADATTLPFATASVDVVLIVHVFHLIPDWPSALSEALRVLRPGGSFVYGSEQNGATSEERPINERWRALLTARGITPRHHRSTDEAVHAALRARGLAPVTETVAAWAGEATRVAITAPPGASPTRFSPKPTPRLPPGPPPRTLSRGKS